MSEFAPSPTPPTDPMKRGVWQILANIAAGTADTEPAVYMDEPPPPDMWVDDDEARAMQQQADNWTEREAS